MAKKITITNRYWIVPNEIINDPNLSWKAAGLYAYIQSKPDDWDFAVSRICQDATDGRDSTERGLKELEKAGYLERVKHHNEKGKFDTEYILHATPVTENPSRINQTTVTEKPVTENPVTENPEINKDRNTNKEIINKETIRGEEVFNDFEIETAKRFLDAHIKNQTAGVLYQLKVRGQEDVIKKYAEAVQRLTKINKLTEEQITWIINFVIDDNADNKPQQGFWWLDQIQTIQKLREKNKEGVPYYVVIIDKIKLAYQNKQPNKWVRKI